MGVIEVRSQNQEPNRDSQVKKLDLKLDLKRDIQSQLSQLQHWSLQEIRETYAAYQRKCQCPFIDSFQLKKILPFQKPTAKLIFEYFAGTDKYISIFELICSLVLLAHHTYRRKMQFIYMIFDFQHRKSITTKELILVYQSFVKGFCRLTGVDPPPYSLLEKYTREYFLRGNPGTVLKTVKLRRLIDQIQGSAVVIDLFNRFQHSEYLLLKEDYMLYSQAGLKKYSSDQLDKIYRIILKAYKQNDYEEVDMVEYNKQLRLGNRRYADFQKSYDNLAKSLPYNSNTLSSLSKYIHPVFEAKSRKMSLNPRKFSLAPTIGSFRSPRKKCETPNLQRFNTKNSIKLVRVSPKKTDTPSLQRFNTKNSTKFGFSPKKNETGSSPPNPQTSPLRFKVNAQFKMEEQQELSPSKKGRVKFLFLNQHTLSKRNIFDAIGYFRTLSNGEEDIKVKQFFKSFEKKAFMKKQLSDLFRVIDTNKNGQISFDQFLKALYPDITPNDIKVVLRWKQEYFKIYYADSLENNELTNNKQQTFNVLPRDSYKRIQQIFKIMDTGNKGFLNYDDLAQSFKTGYTLGDIQSLLKEYGGSTGRILIDSFVKMLLPRGWVIEGYNNGESRMGGTQTSFRT